MVILEGKIKKNYKGGGEMRDLIKYWVTKTKEVLKQKEREEEIKDWKKRVWKYKAEIILKVLR